MNTLFSESTLSKVATSVDDIKSSILKKIEQKSKEILLGKVPVETETSVAPKEKSSRKKPKRSVKDDPDRLNRTLFVGNVPSKCCTDKLMQRELKAIFSAHGVVESVRFRSLALAEAMPRKHAFISGQLSDRINSNNAYVVMKDEFDAQKCLTENARSFHGHHIRVDIAGNSGRLPSHKKSVFVGNLPLDVSDESVWKAFSDCGTVTSVRIIRDKATGMGKGFAYVAFNDRETVKSALLLDGSDVCGRKIRVQKCSKPGEEPKSVHKNSKPAQKPRFGMHKKVPGRVQSGSQPSAIKKRHQ